MKKLLLFLIPLITAFTYAQPTNNNCSGATTIPVNNQLICDTNVEATFVAATLSNITNDCIGTNGYDVWFEFTATSNRHRIGYNIVSGTDAYIKLSLYEDNCDTPTLISCVNSAGIVEDLTIGTTYKVQVHATTTQSDQNIVFTICVNVPLNSITTSSTAYTPEELIEDILISSECMTISNVNYQTGASEGLSGGLGYFEKNESLFNFDNGIILSSGNIDIAPGPAIGPSSSVGSNLSGDEDLEAIMFDFPGSFNDVSWLEFDFVPTIDHISFDFIFAANEYGTYQCGFADAFAFILTNVATGEATNLAVIPGTTIPISVVNIRDSQYNTSCTSVNPQYFDSYYTTDDITAPVNFRGITVPMTAESDVIPGNTYHIKLVIADYNDTAFDSAIFIEGGSFNIGSSEYEYATISTNNSTVLCEGQSTTLSINLDSSFEFAWYLDGVEIPEEDSNSIIATQAGEYVVNVTLPNEGCNLSYSINITEGSDTITDIEISNVLMFEAESDGLFNFDLAEKSALILQDLNFQDVFITFHNTLEDASAGTNALPDYYQNSENPETIYVRIENELSGCFNTGSFQLIILDENYTTPAPQGEEAQSFDEGETLGDLIIEGENIQWYAEDATSGRSAMNTQDEETPLPLDTPLVNGVTYYATQTIYGIESIERLSVTVSSTLSTSKHDFEGFSYHPNPVSNILYIKNNNKIDTVTIHNLLGQSIFSEKVNSLETQINTEAFKQGIYFIKIIAGNSEKTIKIIKE
ncbi:T9SS C-terminal target domain-containing protein [Flavobacterium arcticum]|uniref:T9SS C-terminal target domain-containing protein n=1 Tax=Flavobacterium arcticum TaxID=1784713 RepID=A0A345HA88_9FLAO|nr:choice-of-anchor L domain-containing protein [Flavobacterium arcticum]AXG73498.1 T9SS C-terminal target domain-containing protein [Flavobacterium arcticum]KAF2513287.1 T9SS type A sorting domain-containing protein [Flavobacterium arcticum]